jgi:ribonuclease HI
MGVGWLQIDEEEILVQNQGQIGLRNWPSSTKPELVAIWLALLTIPQGKEVIINSDSAAAIAAIESSREIKNYREWFRQKNSELLKRICDTIQTKEIVLKLNKVKAHAENYWNNRADLLAKAGVYAEKVLNWNNVIDSEIPFKAFWKNFQIETDLKSFLRLLVDLEVGAEWSISKEIEALEENEEFTQYDWSLFWRRLRRQSGIRCDSEKKSKRLSTLIKCIQNKLPTLDELQKRRPDLYKSSNCILCQESVIETLQHLASCTRLNTIWVEAEKLATETLQAKLADENSLPFEKNEVEVLFFGSTLQERIKRREEVIKGLTPRTVISRIQESTGSERIARDSCEEALNILWNFFYEMIWKTRCEKVIKWEEEIGISRQRKRLKRKKAKKRKERGRSKAEELLIEPKERKEIVVRKKQELAIERYITEGIKPFWLYT